MKTRVRMFLAIALFIGLAVSLAACAINTAPVADAGPDQYVSTGTEVTLDGNGSSDADNDTLTYSWSFANVPEGSGITDAALSNATAVDPTFTPDHRGRYVVQLIVNDGMAVSAADTVTITARSWGTAERIDTGTYGAFEPQVAVDASGNAVAVWQQIDGLSSPLRFYAMRYEAWTGWGTAEIIGDYGFDARLAVDAGGNAIVVWRQKDGTYYSIYANRYEIGKGWGAAEIIDAGAYDAFYLQVAVDASGNAVAVWRQSDGSVDNIYANRYETGTGWGAAEIIDSGAYGAINPQVAVDASGNAVAVWSQSDGAYARIYARRYKAGTGWSTEEIIDAGGNGAGVPQVAVDASGNAVAVWRQIDGANARIYARRYEVGTGWGVAEIINTDVGSPRNPHVAVDSSGNAVAVWEQIDGTTWNIYANRYETVTGWGTAVEIDAGAHSAIFPQVAVDTSGNAVAVWRQSDGAFDNIYASRYEVGSGWGTAEIIDAGDYGATLPQVAVDANGNAVAVWQQSNGATYSVYANYY